MKVYFYRNKLNSNFFFYDDFIGKKKIIFNHKAKLNKELKNLKLSEKYQNLLNKKNSPFITSYVDIVFRSKRHAITLILRSSVNKIPPRSRNRSRYGVILNKVLSKFRSNSFEKVSESN